MADAPVSGLPAYVEFGLRSTMAGPFRSTKGQMRMLLLEGNANRIESLVERVLTGPAPGACAYRPLSRHVLLSVGESLVSSREPPENGWGAVREALAAVWVPVWAGRKVRDGFEADRLCMCVTHILVDNPISHAVGRETYGYPKALGRFDPPSDFLEKPLTIHGFGGDFRPDAQAAWAPVLELAPTGAPRPAEPDRSSPGELVRVLLRELVGPQVVADAEAAARPEVFGGIRLLVGVIREALQGHMRQVFLKQFRDATDQHRACHQTVVEGLARTTHVNWRLSARDWHLTVHGLKSHPIFEDLGVGTQPAKWSVELREYEFDVDPGTVIGP